MRWQRESPGEVAALLLLIVVVKVAGATLPLVNERGWLPRPRLWRALFWAAAALLIAYGTINVVAALAVLTGMVETAQATDTAALAGHAFLWDPMFLAWGSLLAAALKSSSPGAETSQPLSHQF